MQSDGHCREQADYFHLDDFYGLGMISARYYQQKFSRHTHEGFCIGVIDEGVQQFFRTGSNHYAPTGDIILVNSDEIHTGSSALETGWAYRAIYPTPEMLDALMQDLKSADRGFVPWFSHAVVHDPGLAAQLRLLFDVLLKPDNRLLKGSLLLSTLAWLITRHNKKGFRPAEITPAGQRLQHIAEMMNSHPETDYSLDELAAMANLSSWYFLRQFRLRYGMPPHAWLIQARLRKARQLLQNGDRPADVSLQCGFTDQSHFTRHFKRAMGVSPGKFMQRR
ncbi:AraC family ligand binding domain-containing protein [Morganella morganii]|uniref:AraC family transcriptional regulator n=1 Tax=Morganella morganii TaxID=582 RepID=UPI000F5AA111|nr:AraC family transcriptional regulator [Morganella morganii]MBC4001344.1 AraC family transcriptional regulator [Morganella morganii]MBT0356275.1 AraC family transcriptional regulator [Morganella morganii subsp. morganii]WHZ55422.1 AraC family transcriptional regulator [Morganella morganii]HBU8229897.1 AraC family transcriptional regulator [Morganella morganii]